MEFHIEIVGATPDVDAINDAILAVDPSGVVDIDPTGHTLRVAAAVNAVELVSLINQAGYPVVPGQVFQVPSICCGGCSG